MGCAPHEHTQRSRSQLWREGVRRLPVKALAALQQLLVDSDAAHVGLTQLAAASSGLQINLCATAAPWLMGWGRCSSASHARPPCRAWCTCFCTRNGAHVHCVHLHQDSFKSVHRAVKAQRAGLCPHVRLCYQAMYMLRCIAQFPLLTLACIGCHPPNQPFMARM